MKDRLIFFLDFRYHFPNIFNIISKSFTTYGCCHPCLFSSSMNKDHFISCYIIIPDNSKVVFWIPLPEIITDLPSTSGIRSLNYKQQYIINTNNLFFDISKFF